MYSQEQRDAIWALRRCTEKHNTNEETALHEAAHHGYLESIDCCLGTDGDCRSGKRWKVDDKNDAHETPLMIAVKMRNVKTVELLLRRGANMYIDDTVDTPVTMAVFNMSSDILNILIENGVNLDFHGPRGNTALMLAVKRKDMEGVRFLLHHRANPSICDSLGVTPLIAAMQLQSVQTVADLVAYHANLFAENSRGETAFDLANEYSKRGRHSRTPCRYRMMAQILWDAQGGVPRSRRLSEIARQRRPYTPGYSTVKESVPEYSCKECKIRGYSGATFGNVERLVHHISYIHGRDLNETEWAELYNHIEYNTESDDDHDME
jgi:hypothetical protein